MNLDEQLAVFVNSAGFFAFFLILLQHLVSVLGKREEYDTTTSTSKENSKDKKRGNETRH